MKIQALRGMQDLLPAQKEIFVVIEKAAMDVFNRYGYREMGLPILEATHLFSRAVGEATDVVEKEMYTFADRNGDSITMRPEGTAVCVRVAQQHGLLFNQVQRFWYRGPMFRYERPQKGRYRQFEQIGVECFGMAGPDIDAEILLMCARLWKTLGLEEDIRLELNSLGNPEARGQFREALVSYLDQYKSELDEDSQRRLETNPLRILDSKVPRTQEILQDAPSLDSYIDNESKAHFEDLKGILSDAGVEFVENPTIVRGLDYYNRTVFEWVTGTLGAQGTVCGGGRYDGLVEQLGGKPTPGVGFAMGLDRLALMLEEKYQPAAEADVYVASTGDAARQAAMVLAEEVRSAMPGVRVVTHCGDGKFKAQLKRADATQAKVALILGENEVEQKQVTVKLLREQSDQQTMPRNELAAYLSKVMV